MLQINLYGCHPVVLITKQTRVLQPTQHRFILIQLVTLMFMLHVSVCTEKILRNPLYGFCIGITVGG